MADSDLIGARLGKYEIQAEIGRGGMGAVYRGYDPLLDRPVAVKVLAPHLVWEQEFVERFLREARAAARLRHAGIVTIHDVGQEGGWYYIVMEYLEGQTLTDLIRQRGPMSSGEVLGILRPLAEALDYAHGQGLVHRDIKPSNVIVGPAGQVTLTDFGIARAAQETRLTATGAIVGTPEYMSPEQAKGLAVGARSDQYSLAATAYEMLSGRVPFKAESTLALLHKIAYEPPPPIRQARPDLPASVETVLGRALAKEPGARYGSVTEFVGVLARSLAGDTLPAAAPASRSTPTAVPTPRRPTGGRSSIWIWGLGGLLLFAVLAVIVFAAVVLIVKGGGGRAVPPAQGNVTATADLAGAGQEEATPTPVPSSTPEGQPAGTEEDVPSPTPPSSPTDTPVPSLTPEAPPTATPLPSATPVPQPTATPVPSATPFPQPTATSTPSPASCSVAVYGAFSSLWQENADGLGCPVAAGRDGVWMAREKFQSGRMVWREDNDKIYVLYGDHRWERFDDIWQEGEPDFSCGTQSSPPTPKRGFGKIWCTYDRVRQGLGDATNVEQGEYGAVQDFSGGSILQTGAGQVYVLFNDGTWGR